MKNFVFYNPTKIVFGKGTASQVGEEVKAIGRKVMLVYGMSHIKQTGLYDEIIKSLSRAGVKFLEYPGVKPNPVLSHTREGIAQVKKENVDAILAVGGGSVIDESKAIAAGAVTRHDIWDFFTGERSVKDALPLGTVLTIPAAGSEMNGGMVITNEETGEKFGFGAEPLHPKFSILDPSLTFSIPTNYSAYSAVDSISHLIEGYFTCEDDWTPIQDRYVEGLVKTIMECTEKILAEPDDYQVRATMMWAATLAWNNLGTTGIGDFELPNHMLEHPLSGLYDIPHGAGLSIVLPAWMTWTAHLNPARIAQLGRSIFNIQDSNETTAAQECTIMLKTWFNKIGSPTSFKTADIFNADIETLADQALILGKVWGIKSYTKNQVLEIYQLCAK